MHVLRPHVRPSSRGGRGPHARAVRGRDIASTKVRALPEWLGQCKLLGELCVPRPPPPPPVRVRGGAGAALLREAPPRRALGPHSAALDAAAAALPVVRVAGAPRTHGWRARPTGARFGVGPEPPGAAARWARRYAHNSELAALPAAADWPNLKEL
jgi:hypothetical protein